MFHGTALGIAKARAQGGQNVPVEPASCPLCQQARRGSGLPFPPQTQDAIRHAKHHPAPARGMVPACGEAGRGTQGTPCRHPALVQTRWHVSNSPSFCMAPVTQRPSKERARILPPLALSCLGMTATSYSHPAKFPHHAVQHMTHLHSDIPTGAGRQLPQFGNDGCPTYHPCFLLSKPGSQMAITLPIQKPLRIPISSSSHFFFFFLNFFLSGHG